MAIAQHADGAAAARRYAAYRRDVTRARRAMRVRSLLSPVRAAWLRFRIAIGRSAPTPDAAFAPLPPSFDPRDPAGERLATPVRLQPHDDDRCVAYAVAAAMEGWWCRSLNSSAGVPHLSIDELDPGTASLTDAAAHAEHGVLDEVCRPPGQSSCADAAAHRWAIRWHQIRDKEERMPGLMCRALLEEGPLAISVRMFADFDGFQDPDGTHVYSPTGAALDDAHALCVVGFDSANGGAWIVKNSRAATWGHKGYGKINWNDARLRPELVVVVVERVTHPVP